MFLCDVRRTTLFVCTCVVVAGAAVLTQPAVAATLEGVAVIQERMALQPDAVFEATLEDISREGVEPVVIGRTRISGPGQPPISFKIDYDANWVTQNGRYVVRAQLTHRRRLLFATDAQNVVELAAPSAGKTEVLLHNVFRAASAAPPTVAAPPPPPAAPSVLGALPATFDGVFPCADCLELKYELNLLPGGKYELRKTYVGKPQKPIDLTGKYVVRGKERVILDHRDGEEERLEIVDVDTLRRADESAPAGSGFSDDLKRRATFQPLAQ